MLLAEKRKKQAVAGKIGHDEYVYKLGDPNVYYQEVQIRGQGNIVRGAPGNVGPGHVYRQQQQGDNRPPYAVDDEAANGRGGNAGGRNNNGPLVLMSPHPNNGGGDGGYPSPALGPGGYGPLMAAPLYAPPVPTLAPPNSLPGLLPPIYKPKGPLLFNTPSAPLGYPAAAQPAGGYTFMPQPMQAVDLQRPHLGPSLPPLNFGDFNHNVGGGGDGSRTPPARTLEPAAPRSPGVGGRRHSTQGVFPGDDGGLSPEAEREMARRRAQQLQRDNAQQMEDQRRRKEEAVRLEREAEAREDARVRREAELRAKRELAEVQKEEEERQAKMRGPGGIAVPATTIVAPPPPAPEPKKQPSHTSTPAPQPPQQTLTPQAVPQPQPQPLWEAALRPSSDPYKFFPAPGLSSPGSYLSNFLPQQQQQQQPLPFPQQPPFFQQQQQQPLRTHSFTTLSTAAAPPSPVHSNYSYQEDLLKKELHHISTDQRRLEHLVEESIRFNQFTAVQAAQAAAQASSAMSQVASNASTPRRASVSVHPQHQQANAVSPLRLTSPHLPVGAGTYLTRDLQLPSATAQPLPPYSSRAMTPTSMSSASHSNTSLAGVLRPLSGSHGGGTTTTAATAAPMSNYLSDFLKGPPTTAGANPPPPSTAGLLWPGLNVNNNIATTSTTGAIYGNMDASRDLTTSSRLVGGVHNPLYTSTQTNGAGGISVLASQVYSESWRDGRPSDPEDLSVEPSKFVGCNILMEHSSTGIPEERPHTAQAVKEGSVSA